MIELAGIVIFGIIAQWFAWKFKIPAILPLILIGLLVGAHCCGLFVPMMVANGSNLFGTEKKDFFPGGEPFPFCFIGHWNHSF